MEKKKNLRQKAEEIIKSKGLSAELKKGKDLEFLLNELDIYETELTIQNEDLKKTQLELEERRKQYTELFEFGPLGYFVFEEEGKILNLNLTACQMFGFFKDDLLNRNFASLLLDEESGDAFYFFKKRILDSGQRQTTELKMQKKEKDIFYALLSGSIVPGGHIMVAVADISEKKEAEKNLSKKKEELSLLNIKLEGQLYELSTIYENVPIGLALLDNELKFLRINKKFSDFNGKSEQDYLGRKLPQIIPELPQTITKDIIQSKNPVLNINFKRNKQKSKEFWQLECYPLKNSVASNKKFLVLLKNITQKKIEEKAWLKDIHQKIVKMEKKKLSKELHDTVSQILFSSNLLAENLVKSWEKNPQKAIKGMERIRDLNNAALLEMQILLRQLTPEKIANESLKNLIESQIDAIDKRSDISFEMQVTGDHEFGYKVKQEVYRIAQEALNNIVKHSKATRVKIHLSLSPSILKFCVSDNGIGFDIKDRSLKRNIGINIMKERAKVIGASLSISSKKGEGASITLVYPKKVAKIKEAKTKSD